MSAEFSLPEIPKVSREDLFQLHEQGEVGKTAYESVRSLAIATLTVTSLIEKSDSFEKGKKSREYAICVGHIQKCNRLLATILQLASTDKSGDAVEIVAHHIHRAAIQGMWLLGATEDRTRLYIERSLLKERQIFRTAMQNGSKEQQAFAQEYFNDVFQQAGVDLERAPEDLPALPSIRQMAMDLKLDSAIFGALDLGHHTIRSTFTDVMTFVEEVDGSFQGRPTAKSARTMCLASVGLSVCLFSKMYAETYFSIPTIRSGLSTYFDDFFEWLKVLTQFSAERNLPDFKEKAESAKTRDSSQRITTPLSDHHRDKKELLPPFLRMPKISMQSWANDRLPETLWAMLLIKGLGRERALNVFRRVIQLFIDREGMDGDITFSGISRLPDTFRNEVMWAIFSDQDCQAVLSSLHVLQSIPGRSIWMQYFEELPSKEDAWTNLGQSILLGFDHQTQESTDCRWLKVACLAAAGKLIFPTEELYREIFEYPNFGDQRGVRPSIRAAEGTFVRETGHPDDKWMQAFWEECFQNTLCISAEKGVPTQKFTHTSLNSENIETLYRKMVNIYFDKISTTSVDAKYETIWGTAFYVLTLIREIQDSSNEKVLGVLGVRVISEAIINLRYLLSQTEADMWKKYRDYGIGQAKLATLKFRESSATPPTYLPLKELEKIANEDRWEEFSAINLGDWSGENLRERSISAGAKEIYDNYYLWPSCFSHSQWAAIRYLVFENCINPLHRFHRIPRASSQIRTVKYDLEALLNQLLQTLNQEYPGIDLALQPSKT